MFASVILCLSLAKQPVFFSVEPKTDGSNLRGFVFKIKNNSKTARVYYDPIHEVTVYADIHGFKLAERRLQVNRMMSNGFFTQLKPGQSRNDFEPMKYVFEDYHPLPHQVASISFTYSDSLPNDTSDDHHWGKRSVGGTQKFRKIFHVRYESDGSYSLVHGKTRHG
jgi:hypothetical protein